MQQQLRLAELLGALSHALDLTEGQPKGHCARCCWIGFHMGKALGMRDQELSDLYYTLLLKDLGCSSNAARVCELYLTDDRSFKQDVRLMDGSLPQVLRFVVKNTGPNSSFAERFRAIVNILRNGGDIAQELFEARCHRGAEIAAKMRFSKRVCEAIQYLDEHWDGSGRPEHRSGRDIPLPSQIALLSQVVDVFHTANGREAAIQEIRNRSGTWFQPDLVELFMSLSDSDEFWDALPSEDLKAHILKLEPVQEIRFVDEFYLDEIATAFAQVIDSKSPFTRGHSERVAVFTDLIAEELGYSFEQRRWLKRAALLHDIGKLAVSNTILDKPAKLTDEEFAVIKMHPVHSAEILSAVSVFADLSEIAFSHHERIDGKGYPRGLKDHQISPETRIVTVADVFDALTADRPYRKAMPASQALAIMTKDLGTAFDPECFAALQRALNKIDNAIAA